MAVKIRLARFGAKKQPYFRLVVADARSPRDGRFVDTIGHYNPKSDPPLYNLDQDRARLWLSRGAQPSEAAARVLFKFGLVEQPWKDAPGGAGRHRRDPAGRHRRDPAGRRRRDPAGRHRRGPACR